MISGSSLHTHGEIPSSPGIPSIDPFCGSGGSPLCRTINARRSVRRLNVAGRVDWHLRQSCSATRNDLRRQTDRIAQHCIGELSHRDQVCSAQLPCLVYGFVSDLTDVIRPLSDGWRQLSIPHQRFDVLRQVIGTARKCLLERDLQCSAIHCGGRLFVAGDVKVAFGLEQSASCIWIKVFWNAGLWRLRPKSFAAKPSRSEVSSLIKCLSGLRLKCRKIHKIGNSGCVYRAGRIPTVRAAHVHCKMEWVWSVARWVINYPSRYYVQTNVINSAVGTFRCDY